MRVWKYEGCVGVQCEGVQGVEASKVFSVRVWRY